MSEKKGETKRQHYVPRMILRNFSEDGKRLSLAANGRIIHEAALSKQCYEDYFYGEDNVVEKGFAEEEGRVAAILGDLDLERLSALDNGDLYQLKKFVHYQYARTRGAAEKLNRMTSSLVKSLLRTSARVNGAASPFTEADVAEVSVGLKRAQDMNLAQAVKSLPILLDMEVAFLTAANRSEGFVISDHPVVLYNRFAESHPRFGRWPAGAGGVASKGAQLYMPLSPDVTLALFDPSSYAYAAKRRTCRARPSDVMTLNRMQAINAMHCYYFNRNRFGATTAGSLAAARAGHPSIYDSSVHEGPFVPTGEDKASQFVAIGGTGIRLDAGLSFVSVTCHDSYDGYDFAMLPIRSPEVFQFTEDYRAHVESRAQTAGAADPQQE